MRGALRTTTLWSFGEPCPRRRRRRSTDTPSRGAPGTMGAERPAQIGASLDGMPDGPRIPQSRMDLEGGDEVNIWGLSKRKANYQAAPRPDVRCDRCKYMFPPLALGGCRLVRGVIRGSATCDEFTPRRTQ